jgi:glycosyltransferase involved in cell wall biosynthesis
MKSREIEVSVVLPCLNEEDTLELCISKARQAFEAGAIAGEIIVADNGSTDRSVAIANRLGARVVSVEEPGYGSALMGGIAAARGKFVIMGDADDSYDFLEIPRFVEKLREGYDLVQGCRFPSGGGRIEKGAMPFSHQWLGNPILSLLVRRWFGAPVHDVYCGLRGFTRTMFENLDLRCRGMEFATEMIIKASLHGKRMTEVPITLHPDGRKTHAPHLKTVRDGWRTIRFFLVCSPGRLFMVPGIFLVLLGMLGYAVAMPGLQLAGVTFDAHTLVVSSLAILLGYQAVVFAVCARTFSVNEGLIPDDRVHHAFVEVMNLEKGLLLGVILALAGCVLILVAVNQWRLTGFGGLDYGVTMRWVVPGVTLTALGFQTMLSSFMVAILKMHRK